MVQQETAITVEVIEELTEDELADRHRLEMKVERGTEQVARTLFQIGMALRELRERRLYRSTHRRWSDYCNERFNNIKRRQADYFILASEVIDELKNGHNCAHFPLPTSESQIRLMKNLTLVERVEAWQTGVDESDGGVPTAKTIKGIVERIKERNTTPPQILYQLGDVFLISTKTGELKKYSGCWALATQINNYTVSVRVHDGELIVKPENLEPIDSPSEAEEIRAIAQRIWRLRQFGLLDRGAYYVLEGLGRQTSLTPLEAKLLAVLEQEYGIQ